jgi:hypothetical protein
MGVTISKTRISRYGHYWQVEFFEGKRVIGGTLCDSWKSAMIRALVGWNPSVFHFLSPEERNRKFVGLVED